MARTLALTPAELATWMIGVYSEDNGLGRGRREWTAHLGQKLAKLAEENGCDASGHRPECQYPEYLVDHCWSWRTDKEGDAYWEDYDGLVFAAEFEWGGTPTSIWDDFVKLMDVRADARLFVGNIWPSLWVEVPTLINKLKDYVARQRHGRAGEWVVVVLSTKDAEEQNKTWLIERGDPGAASLRTWSAEGRCWS